MKLFLIPLLLAGAGLFGLRSSEAAAECETDCTVSVECVDETTCRVTCTAPDGEVVCQEVVPCDELPCDLPCDAPCETKAECTPEMKAECTPAKAADCSKPSSCMR
jgi:hypothetical protein